VCHPPGLAEGCFFERAAGVLAGLDRRAVAVDDEQPDRAGQEALCGDEPLDDAVAEVRRGVVCTFGGVVL
jgi:hypothetical protein